MRSWRVWILGLIAVALAGVATWRLDRLKRGCPVRNSGTVSYPRVFSTPPPLPVPDNVTILDSDAGPLPPGAVAYLGSPHFRHAGQVRALAFSPDGAWLASSGGDRKVHLWSTTTGKSVHRIEASRTVVEAIAFTQDSLRLICYCDQGRRVFLWDCASTQVVSQIAMPAAAKLSSDNAGTFAVAPDDRCVTLRVNDNLVQFWDVAAMQPRGRPATIPPSLARTGFTPDGKSLVSLTRHRSVAERWLIETGELAGSVPIEADTNVLFNPIAISADTKLAAICQNTGVGLWDLTSGKRVAALGDWASMAAFSQDGRFLVATRFTTGIGAWEIPSGRLLMEHRNVHQHLTSAVAISRDGRLLASGGAEGTVRLWDRSTGRELFPQTGHVGRLTSLAWSPNGLKIATSGSDGTIRTWRTADGQELTCFTQTASVVLGYLPHERLLVRSNQLLSILAPDNGKMLNVVLTEEGEPGPVSLTPSGNFLATGHDMLRVWNMSARPQQVLQIQLEHSEKASSVALSPDGKWLAAVVKGDTYSVRLIDVASGAERSRIPLDWKHNARARASFLPAVKGNPDWPLRLCYGTSAREISPSGQLGGYVDVPNHAATSPDGLHVAERSYSETEITLWHLVRSAAMYAQPAYLNTRPGDISCLLFSPDGHRLAVAGEDGLVLMYDTAQAMPPQPPCPSQSKMSGGPPTVSLSFENSLSGPEVIPTRIVCAETNIHYVDGITGKALSFTQGVEVELQNPPPVGNSFTFEFWFRFHEDTAYSTNFFQQLVKCDVFSADVRNEGELFAFLHFPRQMGHACLIFNRQIGTLQPGLWYHLAVVVNDESDTTRVYMGGVEVHSQSSHGHRYSQKMNPLRFGSLWPRQHGAPSVTIDEFRFYPYARSAADIADSIPTNRTDIFHPETETANR